MYSFERDFRRVWHYEFGESPERTFGTISWEIKEKLGIHSRPSCDLSTSHFQLSLEDMLDRFRSEILTQGAAANIDPRAVAGAIAWEYEENPLGRYSDYLQYDRFGDVQLADNSGLGWGSVHTRKARQLSPDASDFELQCMRMQAESAIELIAGIMGTMAEKYYELSGGIWINDSPPALAIFYNAGDDLLARSADARKLDACGNGKKVALDVSQTPMASWIKNNLQRFSDFGASPTPPSDCCYQTVVCI